MEEEKDRAVSTDRKTGQQGDKREPNERDESPDNQNVKPRGIIKQAAEDLQQGLVDTDAHATPGVERAVTPQPGASGQANPQPDRNRGMRDHTEQGESNDQA